MKLDIWLDFVCPYCHLGKHRLVRAIELAAITEPIEMIYHSYELNPRARRHTRKTIAEETAAKYGISLAVAEESNRELTLQAAELGLTYNLDQAIPTNTHDAHRVAKFVQDQYPYLADALIEKFFKAHFTDGEDLGDPGFLADIAEDVGISREETLDVLVSDQYDTEVRDDLARARSMQVPGVPFFLINGKYSISGAQPIRVFATALKSHANEDDKADREEGTG